MFPSSSVFAGLPPHWSSRATVGEAGVAEDKKAHLQWSRSLLGDDLYVPWQEQL